MVSQKNLTLSTVHFDEYSEEKSHNNEPFAKRAFWGGVISTNGRNLLFQSTRFLAFTRNDTTECVPFLRVHQNKTPRPLQGFDLKIHQIHRA
jgi:hypothetical protein